MLQMLQMAIDMTANGKILDAENVCKWGFSCGNTANGANTQGPSGFDEPRPENLPPDQARQEVPSIREAETASCSGLHSRLEVPVKFTLSALVVWWLR